MPIKGLTDRQASFPQIGVLRKGAPKTGNKPGEDLRHFRFDTDDTRAAEMFRGAYGNEPTEINIYFAYQTPEENFHAWQEEYSKSSLKHRCDGQTAVLWLDERTGKYSQVPKPCPGGCKPTGRLLVIVPELQRFAYVVVGTTSIHDIMRVTQNLEALYAMRGDLRGIPFVLRRTPEMISTPTSDGGRARREKWLLSVEALPEWVALQLQTTRQEALNRPRPLMLTVNAETGEIVDDDEDASVPAQVPPAVTPVTAPAANGNGHKAQATNADTGEITEPEPAVSQAQLTKLNTLGREFYTSKKWDEVRPSVVAWATDDRATSAKELTAAEADKIIASLKRKIVKAAAEAQSAPKETPPPTSAEDAALWAKGAPEDAPDINF